VKKAHKMGESNRKVFTSAQKAKVALAAFKGMRIINDTCAGIQRIPLQLYYCHIFKI
jgi:hypothetical protein